MCTHLAKRNCRVLSIDPFKKSKHAMGALASLKTLIVDDGPLGTEHPALKAACEARGISLE